MTNTGLLIDVKENVVKIVEVNDYKDYYKLVGCDTFDIATRKINGETFALVVDDEGALKEHPILSAIYQSGILALFGNILILKQDGEDLIGLTKDQIQKILHRVNCVAGQPLLWLED